MYDICIIGAGIAGSSLATVLGRSGFRVALIDRSWEQSYGILGELLQPGGVPKLQELGLEGALDGIDAQPINGYALSLDNEWLHLGYPPKPGKSINGYGFRYGRFIQNLQEINQSIENVVALKVMYLL